jgi:hypothetical protein
MSRHLLARRATFLLPLAAAPATSALAAEATATPSPSPAPSLAPSRLLPAAPLAAEEGAAAARQGALALQAGDWRLSTHGDLAAAYLNTIPTFRQAAGDDARLRPIGDELRERVAFTQFETAGRLAGEAIAAAIDYLRRNNGAVGGEVVLPQGRPIQVVAPIAAAPGVMVRGPRLIEAPRFAGVTLGVFDVDGADDFALADIGFSLGRRCSPVRVRGDAAGFSARGLRIREGRSIWFQRARQARLMDIVARGGTSVIGAGAGPDDRIEDVVATGIQGYDLHDEAIDLNFNVRSFHLSGFTFRRCSLARNGEVIDIGGGDCSDISIANGLIDCSGSTHSVAGIRIKQGTRNVNVTGVHIVNGKAQGGIGIHVTHATNLAIGETSVDNSFGRGFFSEPSVSDVTWRGGRCDSPIIVNGSSDLRFDISHDGGGTESRSPAFSFGFGARRISVSGVVRNRPMAPAVVVGHGRGGAVDCTVSDLTVQGTQRAVAAQDGCHRLSVSGLRAQDMAMEAVLLAPGCRNTHLRGIMALDGSASRPAAFPAIRLGRDCHGTVLRDITARDTREGVARASGPALIVDGPCQGVMVDGVLGDNLPAATQIGVDRLQGSAVGAVLTIG